MLGKKETKAIFLRAFVQLRNSSFVALMRGCFMRQSTSGARLVFVLVTPQTPFGLLVSAGFSSFK